MIINATSVTSLSLSLKKKTKPKLKPNMHIRSHKHTHTYAHLVKTIDVTKKSSSQPHVKDTKAQKLAVHIIHM